MRSATAARLGVGTLCLAAPAGVLRVVGGPDRGDSRTLVVVRVLGARWVAQSFVDLALGRRTRTVDAAVDLLHAASMLPVGAWSRSHRRSALASAGVATAIALLDAFDTPEAPAREWRRA